MQEGLAFTSDSSQTPVKVTGCCDAFAVGGNEILFEVVPACKAASRFLERDPRIGLEKSYKT
jgi:hypothetical protein